MEDGHDEGEDQSTGEEKEADNNIRRTKKITKQVRAKYRRRNKKKK